VALLQVAPSLFWFLAAGQASVLVCAGADRSSDRILAAVSLHEVRVGNGVAMKAGHKIAHVLDAESVEGKLWRGRLDPEGSKHLAVHHDGTFRHGPSSLLSLHTIARQDHASADVPLEDAIVIGAESIESKASASTHQQHERQQVDLSASLLAEALATPKSTAQPSTASPDIAKMENGTSPFVVALRDLVEAETNPRAFFLDQEAVREFVNRLKDVLYKSDKGGYCLEDGAAEFQGFGCTGDATLPQLCHCRGLLNLCWTPGSAERIVSEFSDGDKSAALADAKAFVLGQCYSPVWLPYALVFSILLFLGLIMALVWYCCTESCRKNSTAHGRELRLVS